MVTSVKNGKLHGISYSYTENGKPQGEIPYKNGLVDGTIKRYDENGKIVEGTKYKDGKEVK